MTRQLSALTQQISDLLAKISQKEQDTSSAIASQNTANIQSRIANLQHQLSNQINRIYDEFIEKLRIKQNAHLMRVVELTNSVAEQLKTEANLPGDEFLEQISKWKLCAKNLVRQSVKDSTRQSISK